VRAVFTQEGNAQEAPLAAIVAMRDVGAVAPLVQALYWLRPNNDYIDRA